VKYKSLLAMLLLAAVAHGAKIDPNFPEGWQKMGGGGPDRMRGRCDVGVDKKLAKKGQKNMTVRCDEAVPGFGGLTQGFAADEFRGKRARFSARLMTHNLYDINGVEGVGSLGYASKATGRLTSSSRKTCVTAGSRTIRARKISRSISANAYGALSLRGSAG
jgi:hypothetical protein